MRQPDRPAPTALITGAAGFIGSALASALLATGRYSVVAVDNLTTGVRNRLPADGERFRFVRADVNNRSEISPVFADGRFDYVFHFAAVVGVQRTLANPLLVLADIDGIKNILSLSRNSGVRRVFYSSSSEVYGEPVSLPQHEETTPLNSRLPYAIVKNLGEAYFRSYYAEHGLPYTIFRFFNTYGPNQSEEFVIPRFVAAAMRGKPLTINGDGKQTRTFCHIDDNVDAVIGCLERDLFVNDVLNVGSDVEHRVLDLARLILRITGSSSPLQHLPALKEGDMTRRQPDIAKMRQVLHRPLLPVDEGIRRLLAFKAREAGA